MKIKAELMDEEAVSRTMLRLAHEILEKNHGTEKLAIVGIRNRGDCLARRIIRSIQEIDKKNVPFGELDITLYRDDFQKLNEQPVLQETNIPFDVTDLRIVLVDDVLYTGRTIRSAMDALMDLGRPALIQLAVLIDRGHRELPIKADYVGKNIPTSSSEQVQVLLREMDGVDRVNLVQV
ncbi:bifunctional pyr operon transcriptional regulator/uracil phosphoribosyltransferase PyrR [bacterium]|nr:bifunctional pyr operon transcriptional regulator/uracil phosphoribosyltransferase PyrR [bacterium]